MTTAERLRECVPFHPSIGGLLILAATELDQRDDTITTLRGERDRFREALKQAESPCTCGHGRFGILHTHDCAISLRNSALKGETK